MNAVINELTPAQRALLHAALENFKEGIEQNFEKMILNGGDNLYKEFYAFTQEEIRNLQNKLFAECFIDDMNFMDHFNKQFQLKKELQAQAVGKKEITV
jgi:hypothetical protein